MSQTPARIVLDRARSLIAEERCWLQYGWKRGNQYVMRRCAYQAVVDAGKASGLETTRALTLLAGIVDSTVGDPRNVIPEFNDSHTHADVMALFDLALETV